MVTRYDEGADTDRIFHALSNAVRRDILRRVMTQSLCVSALAKRYPVSFTAVQKHVAVLESANLVSKRARGREQLVRGEIGTIAVARDLLEDLEEPWRDRPDGFEDLPDRSKG